MPTDTPTETPTVSPTAYPTPTPTEIPSEGPTVLPTNYPTNSPTNMPTNYPSNIPTDTPTGLPTTYPSNLPTIMPTGLPSDLSTEPTTSPTKIATDCIAHEDWTQDRADELCPGVDHKAYGVELCETYDNPDYRRRLAFALANGLYTSCSHGCLYDYDSYNTSRPHAFRWTGECYNVATGYYCIAEQVDAMSESHLQAANLCIVDTDCVERVAWTQEVAESNCPDGYSNGDKGWGTAKICPTLIRRNDGFYDRAEEVYGASFNLSLANHIFWSCSAKCIYDINDDGVAYQWKGSCWEMQTQWACFTVHTSEYRWALEYVDDRVCPSAPVETPAPTPFVCVEREQEWNKTIAALACGEEDMGGTDKGATATTCAGYEDYQYRLNKSLANRMFHDCDAWCVYDIYKNADEAFIWRQSETCYDPVRSGLCITTLAASRLEMKEYVENVLCESTTGEPTEAPTCIEQNEWSEDLMDDLCTVDETRLTYKHYSAVGRAAQPCAGHEGSEDDLLKSLAMEMYDDCSSWCVYDYYSYAQLAWKWDNNNLCWDLLEWGSCHWDYSKGENQSDWEDAKERVKFVCTNAPTLAPSCAPYYTWTEERAEDLCESSLDYGRADKSYGVQVCDDDASVGRQANLEKSLANDFYVDCSSWCVYDYDTVVNNIRTGSSDYGGFIFRDDCWKWVTGWFCFTTNLDEFEEVSRRALGLCDL